MNLICNMPIYDYNSSATNYYTLQLEKNPERRLVFVRKKRARKEFGRAKVQKRRKIL